MGPFFFLSLLSPFFFLVTRYRNSRRRGKKERKKSSEFIGSEKSNYTRTIRKGSKCGENGEFLSASPVMQQFYRTSWRRSPASDFDIP